MNDRQLALFIRHAFALERYGEDAVKVANPELRKAILRVQEIIRGRFPEEGLLRDKALRDLMPAVAEAMRPYNRAFAEALVGKMVDKTPEIQEAAIEMVERARPVAPIEVQAGPVAQSVELALKTKVNNVKLSKLFNVDGEDAMSVWTKTNLKAISGEVQRGIIEGTLTEDIARTIAGPNAERRIRGQARAVARTAIQDYNRQVHEEVWDANAEALEGLEYEYVAALDSRTCPTCAPQDGKQEPRRSDFDIQPPVHVNCRCRLVLVDPEDPDDIRNGIQLKADKPTGQGAYKTKVKVKGKKFYRQAEPVKGDTYADYLAGSDRLTQVQFFGGGPIGRDRAQWFRTVVKDKKLTPEKALQKLLTGPVDKRGFKTSNPFA